MSAALESDQLAAYRRLCHWRVAVYLAGQGSRDALEDVNTADPNYDGNDGWSSAEADVVRDTDAECTSDQELNSQVAGSPEQSPPDPFGRSAALETELQSAALCAARLVSLRSRAAAYELELRPRRRELPVPGFVDDAVSVPDTHPYADVEHVQTRHLTPRGALIANIRTWPSERMVGVTTPNAQRGVPSLTPFSPALYRTSSGEVHFPSTPTRAPGPNSILPASSRCSASVTEVLNSYTELGTVSSTASFKRSRVLEGVFGNSLHRVSEGVLGNSLRRVSEGIFGSSPRRHKESRS